jgi:MFS family permease
MTLRAARAASSTRERATVVALAVAVFVYALQQTVLYPGLPVIQRDLHTSTGWVTWLISGYLLVSCASTPLGGKLGDQYGKKRVLVVALSMFFLGAVLATAATNIATLLAARALQGVGGITIPLSASIIRDEFPRERVGGFIGLLFAVTAVGMSTGIAVGGFLVQLFTWRIAFLVCAVLVGIALSMVVVLVPESPIKTPSRADVTGAILLTTSLVCLLLGITQGTEWGYGSPRIAGLFAMSAVAAPLWVLWELRRREPLIDIRMLAQRNVALTNAASFAWGASISGTLLFVPRFVETRGSYGFAASPALAGLYLMPGFAAGLASGPLVSRLARGRSPSLPLGTGAGLLASGSLLLALLHDRPWEVVFGAFVVGVGWPVGSAAMANTILATVRSSETASATAIAQVLRGIGTALGGQIGAALLAAFLLAGGGIPVESAYTTIFLICAGAAILAIVCALALEGPARPLTAVVAPDVVP